MTSLFFNCDWGTSRFRLRLVDAANWSVLGEVCSDQGVARLADGDRQGRAGRFQEVLAQHVSALSAAVQVDVSLAPVLISGMASSTLGWHELPYAAVPFPLDGSGLHYANLDVDDLRLRQPVMLFSGVRSETDIMRGEETELIGLHELQKELFASSETVWVVLPGTHSKHIRVCGSIMTEFHTVMTGELFQLLSQQSSLRHPDWETLTADMLSPESAQWRDSFTRGVELARDGLAGSHLFQVRTGQVLRGEGAVQSAALLSGLLIGDELRSLHARAAGVPIVLAAGAELTPSYELALNCLGFGDRVTIILPKNVALLSARGQYAALNANCS